MLVPSSRAVLAQQDRLCSAAILLSSGSACSQHVGLTHLQCLHSSTACTGQCFCSLTHVQCWALLLEAALAARLPWCLTSARLLPHPAQGLIPCPSVPGPFASCWCHHVLPSPCCSGALPLPRQQPRYSGVQTVPPAASAAIFHH